MKKIAAVSLFILLGFAVMVGAQSVTYDYAFTYNDTRVAFFDYYDPNNTKYETRAGIPLDMSDPNEVEAYLSTPAMLELILVNIRHTEYPNLPVRDMVEQMFDPNNWRDDPNDPIGDPNFYLYYVAYPTNFNPNYNQAVTIIENETGIGNPLKVVLKQMLKVLVKSLVFE